MSVSYFKPETTTEELFLSTHHEEIKEWLLSSHWGYIAATLINTFDDTSVMWNVKPFKELEQKHWYVQYLVSMKYVIFKTDTHARFKQALINCELYESMSEENLKAFIDL